MGLLIGIGGTKPTFPYDYYYGVEWDLTVSTKHPTRIGKAELHQALPLQSMMRRCILDDEGNVKYYLGANDSTKRDNGASADLTGGDGMVMVELPDVYVRFEQEGNKCRCLMSPHALPGFTLWKKDYISAYEATVARSTTTLASVVNTTTEYRGGGNQSAWDGTYRDLLGRPATNISTTNFRAYARKRGSTQWNCNLYHTHRKLYWLFVVEYCTFDSQEAFNAELTDDGYHQGGLSAGVTTLNYNLWNSLNGCNPFVPCGYTNSLGNRTGVVEFTMPFEYNASGAANYAGEYDDATAYTTGQYVSSGELLYRCIADAAAGTALTNTTYFSAVTRTTVNVPSYRGIENPFGHVWKWTDGCKARIQSEDAGGVSEFYVCDTPANFQSTDATNYELRGELPRKEGYVKSLLLGEYGEMLPLEVGGGSTTYMCDYFYTNIPTSGTAERCVGFGGAANNGASAGLASALTYYSPSSAHANCGSRLCFYPETESA